MVDFKMQLNLVNQKINGFFNFLNGKISNFPRLSLGEQISYSAIGLGVILLLTSMVMFVV